MYLFPENSCVAENHLPIGVTSHDSFLLVDVEGLYHVGSFVESWEETHLVGTMFMACLIAARPQEEKCQRCNRLGQARGKSETVYVLIVEGAELCRRWFALRADMHVILIYNKMLGVYIC